MKILFVADVPVEAPASGSEQVLYQQATGLARMGHQIYAITRQEKGAACSLRKVDGLVEEASFYANPRDPKQFFKALQHYPGKFFDDFSSDSPFQAVICHQPFVCLALSLCKEFRLLPKLYIFHSPSHEEYQLMQPPGRFLKTMPQVLARRIIEWLAIRNSVMVLPLSAFMAGKARQFHHIAQERIRVNPGGVDLERFKPFADRRQLKKELGLPPDRIHLLTIRNLEPRMGVENLVKAMAILKGSHPQLHLTIGGSGESKEEIARLVEDNDLANSVCMAGFIPAELLADTYAAADFFIIPTLSLEGFGLVTPESLASGTPVLGTPVGGTAEILGNFDPHFLFHHTSPESIAAGIREIVILYPTDSSTYASLRSKCRQFAEERYSWQRHLEALDIAMDEVVSQAKINV